MGLRLKGERRKGRGRYRQTDKVGRKRVVSWDAINVAVVLVVSATT